MSIIEEQVKPLQNNPYLNWAREQYEGKPGEFAKVLITDPPYVLWMARAPYWTYYLDGFTGEIIKKESTVRIQIP